ncbi:MAG: hypothetical protein EBZ48_06905 [Proteobacteria bacterium]|nr:hypothetical protein [Pseudomonadota bacterium]
MRDEVKKYLAEIGRRGGKKSRRRLSSQSAKEMVRVREARRAYRRFYPKCFWSYDPKLVISATDIPWVVEHLMKNGNRAAWEAAQRLCR